MSLLFVGKVVYVLSSVGPQQMKIVIKAVQDGGGSVSTDPNDESITHVICGNSQVSHAHLQSQFGGLTVEAVVQVSYFPRCKMAGKMLNPTEPEFAVYISGAGVVESTPPAAEDQVSSVVKIKRTYSPVPSPDSHRAADGIDTWLSVTGISDRVVAVAVARGVVVVVFNNNTKYRYTDVSEDQVKIMRDAISALKNGHRDQNFGQLVADFKKAHKGPCTKLDGEYTLPATGSTV